MYLPLLIPYSFDVNKLDFCFTAGSINSCVSDSGSSISLLFVINLTGHPEVEIFSCCESMLQLDLTDRTDVLDDGLICFDILEIGLV